MVAAALEHVGRAVDALDGEALAEGGQQEPAVAHPELETRAAGPPERLEVHMVVVEDRARRHARVVGEGGDTQVPPAGVEPIDEHLGRTHARV